MLMTRGEFSISSERGDQQAEKIHEYLTRSYWASGISLQLVKRCIANSLCFGVFHRGNQIGFARVVTDRASFAYLCDVYLLEEYRGKGLARWMLKAVLAHPDLQRLRRFMLVTRDAQGLYTKLGFVPTASPQGVMEIVKRGLYQRSLTVDPG